MLVYVKEAGRKRKLEELECRACRRFFNVSVFDEAFYSLLGKIESVCRVNLSLMSYERQIHKHLMCGLSQGEI